MCSIYSFWQNGKPNEINWNIKSIYIDQLLVKIKLEKKILLIAACLDGQGRGSDSQCRDCEQGTYRAVGQQDNCTACPDGWTTAASKSVNITQCNIGKFRKNEK